MFIISVNWTGYLSWPAPHLFSSCSLLSRCGSRTGGWRTSGRDTPCRGLTLLWTPWERSWWAVPLLPPPYLTHSSRPTSHTFPSTTTTPWLSPHQDPLLTVATAHLCELWMHSACPSTTTDQGGCLQPQQPSTPPPASCIIQPHALAPSAFTGDQNNCSKLEGRHWDWANPTVPKPTSSLAVWSGGKRWCNPRQTRRKAVKQAAASTSQYSHCDFNSCDLHDGAC